MTCSDLDNELHLLALSFFIAVAELDASNFCIIERVTMVAEMLRDRETRHVLSNTPKVLAGFTHVEGLAVTTGDAVLRLN